MVKILYVRIRIWQRYGIYIRLTTRETTRETTEEHSSILEREIAPLKKINDNYPKYILTLGEDLDADFDGIKKINILDWLLNEKS